MPTSTTPANLGRDIDRWIADAPDHILQAILFAPERQLILQAVYRDAIAREGLQSDAQPTVSRQERIVTAIRIADLHYRRDNGTQLERIADYERYRDETHPSRTMIYDEFGSWPHALLAARDDKFIKYATQRKQGGNRKQPAFTDQQHERALLEYAEQHAGVIPGKNEYERWVAHRPDLPTPGQIAGRRNGQNGRPWTEVQAAAAKRALTESGWPLTRMRLEVDQQTAPGGER